MVGWAARQADDVELELCLLDMSIVDGVLGPMGVGSLSPRGALGSGPIGHVAGGKGL